MLTVVSCNKHRLHNMIYGSLFLGRFLTDLNPWGAMALASTASKNEALKVHDMIYRHLTFESYICVRDVAVSVLSLHHSLFLNPYNIAVKSISLLRVRI